MKVEVLRLIEDALIGGRAGDNAWIENNPLICQLWGESEKSFKDFLSDCINGTEEKEDIQDKRVEYIIKRVKIDKYSAEYSEYDKAVDKENEARKEVNKKFNLLAEKTSPLLAELSTYKIEYGQYDTYIEYKILPSLIKDL